MNQRVQRLAEEPIGKLLWSFSVPAIVGMVLGSLYTAIDRAFLGNVVGAEALAGVSLCMPFAFMMLAFGTLIAVGTGALVSIRLGQKKKDEAELILGNAVSVALLGALVLTPILLHFLPFLLVLFGASPATLPYALQFMQVILLGSLFQYWLFGLNAVIRAEGHPRLAMLTMLINALLNIALDAVFILWLGFGVTGAAVATVIAQGVATAWTLIHFGSGRSTLKLRLKNLRPRWRVLGPALAIGSAPFSMHLAASIITLLLNRALARHGGDDAIGAYGAISALAMLILMPLFGLNQGAQPIIGYNFGAGQMGRVRQTFKYTVIVATAVVMAGFVVVQSLPDTLMRIFVNDQRVIDLGTRGLHICFATLPIIGFQIVGANFFQAIGKAKIALLLSLLRQVIVLIPLLLLLPNWFGLDGVWAAGPIADTTASVLTAVLLLAQMRALAALPASPMTTMVTPAREPAAS